MMREMLTRRLKALLRDHGTVKPEAEENDGTPAWPDILLIDGGKGQLSAVEEVLADLGINEILPVAISKGPDRHAGREQFHIPGRPTFSLDMKDPALYFLQRLRDEAHRFAIGGHRIRRKKKMKANPLDEIPGIGPKRKRALLNYFGSAKAVQRANLKDLTAVEGISSEMAETIFDFFHEPDE
jgi:excinuclease ABC subunit C